MSVARVFSILIYPMTLLTFLLGPFIVYMVFRKDEDARFHMRNAMNLQLTAFFGYFLALILLLFPYVFGLAVGGAVAMYHLMFIIIGAVQAGGDVEEKIWTIPVLKPEA